MDIQPNPPLVHVLKWVAIAFAAGFVGYFGRYLGKIIIARLHKKEGQALPIKPIIAKPHERESEAPPTAQPAQATKSELNREIEKDKLKLDKKKMKLEKKKLKGLEKQEGKRD